MVLTLCKGQRARGHRVLVAIRDRGEIGRVLRQEGIEIVEPTIGGFSAPVHLARVCRKNGVEILHPHLVSGTHVANAVSVLTGIPVVNHLHVYNRDLSHVVASRLGVLIAVSKHTESYYAQRPLLRRDRIVTVPNGSAISNEPDAKLSRDTARRVVTEELGWPENSRIITLAGRVTHQKGQDIFLDSIPAISAEFPTARFILVGSVEDQEFTEKIRETIQEQGLTEQVRLLGFRRDMARLLRASEIAVVPSRYEPFALSVIEPMLLGTPTVAANVGGIPENISRPELGVLVEDENPQALAQGVLSLMRDPDWAKSIAETAQTEAVRRFSVEAMLDQIDDVYTRAARLRKNPKTSTVKS